MVYQPFEGHLYPTHRLADEWNLRHEIYSEAAGTHRHHRDFNRRNNRPTNIERMEASEHIRVAQARCNPSDATREPPRRAMFRRFADPAERLRRALHVTGSIPGAADACYRNHKVSAVRELPGDHDVYCLTVPEAGNFGLEAGVFVRNCGIIVNVTPLEPEWEGHVTLEFSNTTPLPAKIYANEGVAQMLFFESDEVCATSYKDRGGKYQGQRGVTLPKT